MKMHRTLKKIGNICFIVTSVNTAEGIAIVKVTDRSESTNPGLLDRLFDVSSSVTVMTVRFPVEGCFDRIQHHRLRGVAELEVGDRLNAVVFHDAEFKEIALVSVEEKHFLRNELKRFEDGAEQNKPQPKNRNQAPEQKDVAAGNGDEVVTSGYNLELAFKQNGAHEQDDGGPVREDVVLIDRDLDIRTGQGHHRSAPRRQRQQLHERNRAA